MSTPAEDPKIEDEEAAKGSGSGMSETAAPRKKATCASGRKDITCNRVLVISIAGLILPVALIIAWHQGNQYLVSDVNDTKTFLTFLAFVVALAAYLANVAREIIKKLNDAKGDDRLKLKCNIAWTTAAEMQLVALGLFVFVRIIFGKDPFIPTPFIREPILLDNIIWIYLGLTLLLLAFLHFRVWKNECPFDIHKDSK